MSKEQAKEQALEFFERGLRCVALLGHERAIVKYNEAINLDPRNPKFQSKKGDSLLVLGRIEEAIECYKVAVELEPSNDQYHMLLKNAMDGMNIYETGSVETEIYSQELSPLLGQNDYAKISDL